MLLDLWFCCENCYDKPKNCYDKPNEIKFLGPQKWGIFIGKGVRLLSSVYYYFEVVGSEDFRQDVIRFYGARETNLTKKINTSSGQKKQRAKFLSANFPKKCPC